MLLVLEVIDVVLVVLVVSSVIYVDYSYLIVIRDRECIYQGNSYEECYTKHRA